MEGVMTPVPVFHFTYIEGGALGGLPLFRCETCKLIMAKGIVKHSETHGAGQVIVDVFTNLEADQARQIMEEVRNTALTYQLLEATDRDDIPAFQCAECEEKLTALGLGTHLEVHGAKTYKIDSRHLAETAKEVAFHYAVAVAELFEALRQEVRKNYAKSREQSLVLTNLDQAELWLTKCKEVEDPGYLVRAAQDGTSP